MTDVRVKAGACLFAGAAQFLMALALAETLYPDYSLSANPLSDLGAGALQPSSAIFNGSVIVFGLSVVLGAAFAVRGFGSRTLAAVLVLAGIGMVGVGIFTETMLGPHLVFSFLAFFCSGVAAVLSFQVTDSPFRYFAAVLGGFALAALVLFITGVDFGLGHGGIQRLIVYPALAWYMGFGAHTAAR